MISGKMKTLFVVLIFGSIVVGLIGYFYTAKDLPPYPGKVVSETGTVLTDKERILAGQQVWQKYGLMDLGSVWGMGTYRGPDFTAQALYRMGQIMREKMARDKYGASYMALPVEAKGAVDATVIGQIKTNRYDKATDTLTLTSLQEAALLENRKFYDRLFLEGDKAGPIKAGTIKDPKERQDLADFFFWTAWCSGTIRPGDEHTYTNNWPYDPSVGNSVSAMSVVWSALSLIAFLFFCGLMIYFFHRYEFNRGSLPYKPEPAAALSDASISGSQKKTAKYFLVVSVLFLLQVLMGGLMAHYTVHPQSFWGLDFIPELIPYNWVKTWHLQLAVFWIATAWIATTLFVAPRVGGKEPKGQGFLVDLLFVAVLVVALGSLLGEVLGIKGLIQGKSWFWLGHQGWEYLELGRLWQILLLVGLIVWLGLVVRALKSHFASGQANGVCPISWPIPGSP